MGVGDDKILWVYCRYTMDNCLCNANNWHCLLRTCRIYGVFNTQKGKKMITELEDDYMLYVSDDLVLFGKKDDDKLTVTYEGERSPHYTFVRWGNGNIPSVALDSLSKWGHWKLEDECTTDSLEYYDERPRELVMNDILLKDLRGSGIKKIMVRNSLYSI